MSFYLLIELKPYTLLNIRSLVFLDIGNKLAYHVT